MTPEELNKLLALEANVNLLVKHNKDLMHQVEQLTLQKKELQSTIDRQQAEYANGTYNILRKEVIREKVIKEMQNANSKVRKELQQARKNFAEFRDKYLAIKLKTDEKHSHSI